MRESTETPAPRSRPGRCANHPPVAAAGACSVCGRPLCIACAVLVRGDMVGPECVPSVLEDVSGPVHVPPLRPVGDRLATAGFGLILALSVLPWSRFGGSGLFSAWRPHWSLVAVMAAAAGLALALVAWRRSRDPVLESLAYSGLALISGGAALLQHAHPPPLTASAPVPLIALAGAALALAGGVGKGLALRRAAKPRP